MKYCRNCATALVYKIPPGEDRERDVCPACGEVHYINPLVVVGALPIYEDKVLLCLRDIEPRKGKWTLPAGFLEMGETLEEGAKRETKEEAMADIDIVSLYTMYSVPQIGQIHIFFRANLPEPKFDAGMETVESRLFSEHEIPWDNLSFPVVIKTLKYYFEERKTGNFNLHVSDIRMQQRK